MLVPFDRHFPDPDAATELIYINPYYVIQVSIGSDPGTVVITTTSFYDGQNEFYIVDGMVKDVAELLNTAERGGQDASAV